MGRFRWIIALVTALKQESSAYWRIAHIHIDLRIENPPRSMMAAKTLWILSKPVR